jgi:hypothetical protein
MTKLEAKLTCISHVVQILKLMLRPKQIRLTWACGRAFGEGGAVPSTYTLEKKEAMFLRRVSMPCPLQLGRAFAGL